MVVSSDSGPLRLARTPSPPDDDDDSPPTSPEMGTNHMLMPHSPGPPRPKSPMQVHPHGVQKTGTLGKTHACSVTADVCFQVKVSSISSILTKCSLLFTIYIQHELSLNLPTMEMSHSGSLFYCFLKMFYLTFCCCLSVLVS